MPQLLRTLRKLSLRRKSQNGDTVDLSDGTQSPIRRKLSRRRWSLRRKSRIPSTQVTEEVQRINNAIGEVSDKLTTLALEQQHPLLHECEEIPPAYARDDPLDLPIILSAPPFLTEDEGMHTEEPIGSKPLFSESQLERTHNLQEEALSSDVQQLDPDLVQVLAPIADEPESPSAFHTRQIEHLEVAISQLSRQVEILLQNQRNMQAPAPVYTPPPPSPPAYQGYSAEYEDIKTRRYYTARQAVSDYYSKPRPQAPEPCDDVYCPSLCESPTCEDDLQEELIERPCSPGSCSLYSQQGEGDEHEFEQVDVVEPLDLPDEVHIGVRPQTAVQPIEPIVVVSHCAGRTTASGNSLRMVLSKGWVLFMNWFICQLLLLRIPLLYKPQFSESSIAVARSLGPILDHTESGWPEFINCRLLEWKTTCGFSAVILPSILTLLQVSHAATNPLTRGAGLTCFMLSLLSLLSGGALLFRHKEPKDSDTCLEHAEAFREGRLSLFASMALPIASAVWSLVCLLIAVLSFVWQPVPSETDPNIDNNPLSIGERIGLTVVGIICFVALGMAALSLGRRGQKRRTAAVEA